MHRHFRHTSYAVSSLVLAFVIAGCGSDGASDPASNGSGSPDEATVFDATGDTKKELGIEKWGFATDTDGDLMTYRGYGAKNEVLATVVQKMDRSDPNAYHFTLSMTGPNASASEKIDFTTRPTDDGTQTEVVVLVTENTFEDGSVASKVLERFKADSEARNAGLASSGSLTGQGLHPLDGQLVSRCNETTNGCQNELIDSRIAAAAASGDCGLLKMVGQPLIAGVVGAAAGAISTIWGGPTALVGGAIGAGAGVVGGGAAAVTQCIASRRDATKAAQDLKDCQARQRQQCQ